MEKIAQKQQWQDAAYQLGELYESIPKLMEAVIAAGGGHTKDRGQKFDDYGNIWWTNEFFC